MEEVKIPKIEWILKECPFCGGEAFITKVAPGAFHASCKRCKMRSRLSNTENEAAAAWDERLQHNSQDISRVIETILKKYNEAKTYECINDPLGYALEYTWKNREREKIK